MSLYDKYHSEHNKNYMFDLIKDVVLQETSTDITNNSKYKQIYNSNYSGVFQNINTDTIVDLNKELLDSQTKIIINDIQSKQEEKPVDGNKQLGDILQARAFEMLDFQKNSQSTSFQTPIETLTKDPQEEKESQNNYQKKDQDQQKDQDQKKDQKKDQTKDQTNASSTLFQTPIEKLANDTLEGIKSTNLDQTNVSSTLFQTPIEKLANDTFESTNLDQTNVSSTLFQTPIEKSTNDIVLCNSLDRIFDINTTHYYCRLKWKHDQPLSIQTVILPYENTNLSVGPYIHIIIKYKDKKYTLLCRFEQRIELSKYSKSMIYKPCQDISIQCKKHELFTIDIRNQFLHKVTYGKSDYIKITNIKTEQTKLLITVESHSRFHVHEFVSIYIIDRLKNKLHTYLSNHLFQIQSINDTCLCCLWDSDMEIVTLTSDMYLLPASKQMTLVCH